MWAEVVWCAVVWCWLWFTCSPGYLPHSDARRCLRTGTKEPESNGVTEPQVLSAVAIAHQTNIGFDSGFF